MSLAYRLLIGLIVLPIWGFVACLLFVFRPRRSAKQFADMACQLDDITERLAPPGQWG